jgi:hypothetical protein
MPPAGDENAVSGVTRVWLGTTTRATQAETALSVNVR